MCGGMRQRWDGFSLGLSQIINAYPAPLTLLLALRAAMCLVCMKYNLSTRFFMKWTREANPFTYYYI